MGKRITDSQMRANPCHSERLNKQKNLDIKLKKNTGMGVAQNGSFATVLSLNFEIT